MIDKEVKPITHLPRPPIHPGAQVDYLSTRTTKATLIGLKPPLYNNQTRQAPPSRDMSLNSLHAVTLHNRKQAITDSHN